MLYAVGPRLLPILRRNEFVLYRFMWDETEFKVCPSESCVAVDLSVLAMHGHLCWKELGDDASAPVREEEVCILPAALSDKND